jgi:MFS family permease
MNISARASRNIRLFYVYNFFQDFRPYAPLGILYFAEVSGSFTGGMAVFGIITISAAILELPLGVVSDLIGRRFTLLAGSFFSALSLIGFALSTSYWMLVAGAICAGVAGAMFSGNNDALLHDSVKAVGREAEFHDYLGRTASMFQIALATSAIIGGFIGNFSLRLLMFISVIPQVVTLLVSFFFFDIPAAESGEPDQRANPFLHLGKSLKLFAHNPALRRISIASAWSNAFGEGGYQFQAAFIAGIWPVWAIGIAKTLGNVSAAISFRFSGAVIKRFGMLRSSLFGRIYGRILMTVAVTWVTRVSPLLMSLGGLMFGVQSVADGALMHREYSDEQRATMGSISSLLGSVFFALASVLIGFMADRFSPRLSFLFIQLLMVPPIIILGFQHRLNAKSGKTSIN